MPAPYHSIFTGQMLCLTSNQQYQSTDSNMILESEWNKISMWSDALLGANKGNHLFFLH